MTRKENVRAILECYFAGFKEEIIDSACDRILELEENDVDTEQAKLSYEEYVRWKHETERIKRLRTS